MYVQYLYASRSQGLPRASRHYSTRAKNHPSCAPVCGGLFPLIHLRLVGIDLGLASSIPVVEGTYRGGKGLFKVRLWWFGAYLVNL